MLLVRGPSGGSCRAMASSRSFISWRMSAISWSIFRDIVLLARLACRFRWFARRKQHRLAFGDWSGGRWDQVLTYRVGTWPSLLSLANERGFQNGNVHHNKASIPTAKPRAAPSSAALNADRARVDMVIDMVNSSLATRNVRGVSKVAAHEAATRASVRRC